MIIKFSRSSAAKCLHLLKGVKRNANPNWQGEYYCCKVYFTTKNTSIYGVIILQRMRMFFCANDECAATYLTKANIAVLFPTFYSHLHLCIIKGIESIARSSWVHRSQLLVLITPSDRWTQSFCWRRNACQNSGVFPTLQRAPRWLYCCPPIHNVEPNREQKGK